MLDFDSGLSMAARAAACAYAEHSTDDDGTVRHAPSALTLARWMRASDRTARRARQELVEVGFLILYDAPGLTPGARLVLPTPDKSALATPAKSARVTPDTTPAKSSPRTRGTRENLSPRARVPRAQGDEGTQSDEGAEGQRHVAGFVNLLQANGASAVPKRLIGQVAKQVGQLLAEGIAPGVIEAALTLMVERRLNPATLPSLIPEAELGPAQPRDDKWKGVDLAGYDRA